MKSGGVKNKIFSAILFLTTFLFVAPTFHTSYTGFAADLSDNAVIMLSGEIDGGEVSVDATLVQNTGLNGLTVELSYDTTALSLVNVRRGNALSSLDYITTNPDTEQGYGITPFKINWSGDENDATTGVIFTMFFTVNENVRDGKFFVTLKTERNAAATYIDGSAKTKSVLVNGVWVEIKGSVPQTIEQQTAPAETNGVLLGLAIGGGAIAVAALVALIIFKLKGKRSWTKIK